MGRFINADALVSTGQGVLGNNMFAYCRNSPVFRIDVPGTCDIECDDTDPLDNELVHENGGLGGGSNPNNNSSGSTPNGSNATIYRYGYPDGGAEKLVPSSRDVAHQDVSGLSFSTKPKPGSGMTTIADVNSTGVLIAVVDSMFHVSVYPVGATLEQWRAAGVNSIWTQALLGVMKPAPVEEVASR